ncbi:YqiA/YcfP family alpha/beta fold hydrolase [Candidatus Marinarcus aquaticus]|uniref:Esterase n=1 Tax=Candidatus Marinarcus aquaticus TaxID=2044504 RepID=A0A4Q0XT21_9BACT|nr:YqiA/YcfP family alpha/beta fold hydrolase [Candidatus Marinarcus aquaticus]RXJ59985.1 esterase [Candidatus Marinarcus aquaticus]
MIIYIHGFGSSGFGGKAKLFKEHFKDNIIMPSLSYVPSLAIHTLEQLIELFLKKGEKVSLIGSSLGGYYSMYLANKFGLKAVLINPATTPYKTLDKIGMATNYFDLSSFEVTQEHMQALKFLEVKTFKNQQNFLLLLQTGDELLNYKDALKKLPQAPRIVQEGGDHSFVNIDDYFDEIADFVK